MKNILNKLKGLPKGQRIIIAFVSISLILSTIGIIISKTNSSNGESNPVLKVDTEDSDLIDDEELDDNSDITEDLIEDNDQPKTEDKDTPIVDENPQPDTKPEIKPEQKPNVNPEVKPEKKPEVKPDKPASKPDKPISEPKPDNPVDTQGPTTCTIVEYTTETTYSDLYYPDSEALKELQFDGQDGQTCTAVVTTTVGGKVTSTKTIVVSEEEMIPRQIFIGTREDYLVAYPSTFAMFTTEAARDEYVKANTVGEVRFSRGQHESLRGVIVYAVEKFDENGNVMDMYGPEQSGPFYIEGTRVYFK